MKPNTIIPHFMAIFAVQSTGNVVARCLIAVVVIQAVIFAIYQIRRMRRQLSLLDEDNKIHTLRNSFPDAAQDDHQKRDVWI